jgi:succinate dehydrogenase / fumarate reductase, cytochrome b subunit
MSWFTKYTSSSVGKKQLMALTGLMLAGFLLGHVSGNIPLLFGNADAFNQYANFLENQKPMLYFIELGLLGVFLLHMYLAFKLRSENKAARISGYSVDARKGKKGFMAFTMIPSGIAILAFTIMHVMTFKYGVGGETKMITLEGVEMLDLYSRVSNYLKNPAFVITYILAMLALAIHLGHAITSALQTLGMNHPRYNSLFSFVGTAYTVLVAGLNIAIVIAIAFIH